MKALVKKSVIAASIAAATMFASTAYAADTTEQLNPFTVKTATGTTFTADEITGSYKEVITFNAGGTFDVALLFQATAFNDAGNALSGFTTGLSSTYGIYATYNVSGTYTTSASGVTSFAFTPNSGGISLYLDPDGSIYSTSGYTLPTTGAGTVAVTNQSQDILLASGMATDPSTGSIDPNASTCGTNVGNYCGGFGSTTTIALTTAGSNFFVAPNPFYNLSFQSGVLTQFTVGGTQTIKGTLDVIFKSPGSAVPEPASLGLLGLGLLGLGVARRRKQNQA